MSSNLKVNTILPSTGSNVAIGTAGGTVTIVGNIDIDINSGISTFNDIHISDKIVHDGDTNTAIRFPAADTITFETAGSEKVRIDSSGRIGINTSVFDDSNQLLKVANPTGTSRVCIQAATDGGSQLSFGDTADADIGRILYDHNGNLMSFYTNNTERFRIHSNGFVGVNTEGPSQQFTSYAASGYSILANGPSNGIGLGSNGILVFGNKDLGAYGSGAIDSSDFRIKTSATERFLIHSSGKVKIGNSGGTPDGKLHIDEIGSGDIVAELTTNSPMFTYRNGSGSWFHAGKHPTRDEFLISLGATTTTVETLKIEASGTKFKFPSVKANAAHGESTADIEIGGRHIWKRITSTMHVTTATNVNHFYLAFWRNSSGNKHTCYYRGVVVNVVAGGNYDWSGHGYVTHSSQTILSFNSTTSLVSNTVYNQGHNSIHNNSSNMTVQGVGYSYDGTYLYANFRFTTNLSGTGFKPHYNVEVIDPSQCTYTCAAF